MTESPVVEDFLRPEPAADADILRVHTPEWVSKLKTGTLTRASDEARSALLAGTGRRFLAGRRWHDPAAQAAPCATASAATSAAASITPIPVMAKVSARSTSGRGHPSLQARDKIARAIVVDTDVHHGNGTAAISRKIDGLHLSIHQANNYPAHKPPSTLDLNLEDGDGRRRVPARAAARRRKICRGFQPDMIFYVGGADPYCEDRLGGLDLTERPKNATLASSRRPASANPVVTTSPAATPAAWKTPYKST